MRVFRSRDPPPTPPFLFFAFSPFHFTFSPLLFTFSPCIIKCRRGRDERELVRAVFFYLPLGETQAVLDPFSLELVRHQRPHSRIIARTRWLPAFLRTCHKVWVEPWLLANGCSGRTSVVRWDSAVNVDQFNVPRVFVGLQRVQDAFRRLS